MRRLAVLWSVLIGCGQPTLISCPLGAEPCPDGCVDLAADDDNCGGCGLRCATGASCVLGTCVPDGGAACAVDNGGCSADADCLQTPTGVVCACRPGFTGDGITCAACGVCGPGQFAAAPCSPVADTVCAACSTSCPLDTFEAAACGPTSDLACAPCTVCAANQYAQAACSGTQDTVCGACDLGCATCTGPQACTSCEIGFVPQGDICVPEMMAMCGNGLIEPGETCDDGAMATGDGCSDMCQVEANHYCFGEGPSLCRPGSCVFEPATALPLGGDFELDGAGTASGAGLAFSTRSMVRTSSAIEYPVLIEVDVVYAGDDVTYAGSRGDGLRDSTASDEPTDTLRARLTASTGGVELATGPGTLVIGSMTAPFTPTLGVPYRVRYVDDGLMASVEWFNLTNLAEGFAMMEPSSFHGSADRAFVGGSTNTTIANLRVCSAPALPVTAGLVARYTATRSWTATRDLANAVSEWQDTSGGGHHLTVDGTAPVFSPGLISGQYAGLDFSGGARLSTSAFALTTDVTVFAVVRHRTPATWGAIAHHGSRDDDWSLEQSGFSGDPDIVHWQTNNDNTNVELTLANDASYVLTGRLDGLDRYFSATGLTATSPGSVTTTDASASITAGTKPLYVGSSDAGEASNAFIGELVYFNRALDDTERDAVTEYLRMIWRPR